MKKSLMAGAAVLTFMVFAPGIFAAGPSFNWGIKLGLSTGRVYQRGPLPPGWWGEDNLTRPTVGVFGAFNLGNRFSVQPEILYLANGGGDEFLETGETITLEFDYLHVPILARYRLMQGVRAVPVVFAGPSIGFLLSAKTRSYLDGTLEHEDRITDLYRKVNVGLICGLGVDWQLGRLSLLFDLRLDLGLTDISRPLSGVPITKTRTFSFLVGVGF